MNQIIEQETYYRSEVSGAGLNEWVAMTGSTFDSEAAAEKAVKASPSWADDRWEYRILRVELKQYEHRKVASKPALVQSILERFWGDITKWPTEETPEAKGWTQEKIRAVAARIAETGEPLWHAQAIVGGFDHCNCAKCQGGDPRSADTQEASL